MANIKRPTTLTKDPDATLNFTFDWSGWLPAGVTIDSTTITAASGLTAGAPTTDGSTVTVSLTGGTVGTTYTVQCEVTLSNSEVDQVTGRVAVREE